MKRTLLASTALAFLAVPAFAADLPSSEPAPAPQTYTAPPVFTWTGFYAGVNVGWNQNEMDVRNRGFTGTGGAGSYNPFSAKNSGFIGGFQVGYNQQFDMFVAGVEADLNYLGNRRVTGSANVAGLPGVITGVQGSSRLDWLGTLRARAGVAMDNVFVYGTGGLAFGNPDQRLTLTDAAGTVTHSGTKDDTRFGWTIGAGAEIAVMDNLSFKAEYLYYDLGRNTVRANATAAGPAGTANSARFENNGHIVRAGMNYRF